MERENRGIPIIVILFVLSLCFNILAISIGIRSKRQVQATMSLTNQSSSKSQYSSTDLEAYAQSYYKSRLTKLLTPEEIKKIAKKQYSYSILVNGTAFKENTISMKHVKNISISLAEVKNTQTALPDEMKVMGSICQADNSKELTDYIKINSNLKYEIVKSEMDGSMKYTYNFEDVPKKSVISIEVDKKIKERLRYQGSIEGNQLEIIVE